MMIFACCVFLPLRSDDASSLHSAEGCDDRSMAPAPSLPMRMLLVPDPEDANMRITEFNGSEGGCSQPQVTQSCCSEVLPVSALCGASAPTGHHEQPHSVLLPQSTSSKTPWEAEQTEFRCAHFDTARSTPVSALGVAIMNNSLYFTLPHSFLLCYHKKFYSWVKILW